MPKLVNKKPRRNVKHQELKSRNDRRKETKGLARSPRTGGTGASMADRRLHERITAPEYVIRGCEERVDHRGELGRDATDAHLAASLSVAVRRLAVYRSLRRDAERERVEMAVEEVGGLVANPLVPGMERLLRGGIIHQGGSFLSLPACHSLSSLSSLSLCLSVLVRPRTFSFVFVSPM